MTFPMRDVMQRRPFRLNHPALIRIAKYDFLILD